MVFLGLLPALAHADIYQYVDEQGVVHFTNRPQPGKNWKRVVREYSKGERTTAENAAQNLPSSSPRCPTCESCRRADTSPSRFTRYDRFIEEASALYQIPVPFIKAIFKAEAISTRAGGILQKRQGLDAVIPEVEK
jgi:hypothetical protein